MPTQWLILRGAPSRKDVLSSANTGNKRQSPADTQGPAQSQQRWQTVFPVTQTLPRMRDDSDMVEDDGEVDEPQTGSSDEVDQEGILAALLERSRAIAEESQSMFHSIRHDIPERLGKTSEASTSRSWQNDHSEESFSESLLPPPTQQRSRLLGDASKSFGPLGNVTEEQSLLNLPSWTFQLSSLTPLNALPSSNGKTAFNAPRINLLAFIDELELPSTMPVRNPSRGGRNEVTRAGMTLVDGTGASLQIVLWDNYADEWAGQYLLRGDVIYVQSIALSEYRGQRQGSTIRGSKVQICYRTVDRHNGRRTDPALKPELDLDWDPISQKVKALVQLASNS